MPRARINISAAIIIPSYVAEKWCDVMLGIFDEFRKKQWKFCARKASSGAEHVAAATANLTAPSHLKTKLSKKIPVQLGRV